MRREIISEEEVGQWKRSLTGKSLCSLLKENEEQGTRPVRKQDRGSLRLSCPVFVIVGPARGNGYIHRGQSARVEKQRQGGRREERASHV